VWLVSAASPQPIRSWKHLEFTTIGISARSIRRCLRSSSIEERWCHQFQQVTNYDECHPYRERVEESTTREGKSFKTWGKKLGRSWMRKSWQLFSFAWWTKCWISFLWRKYHPRYGSDFKPLSEEIVGESVDSKAASLSSPHAWRHTYQVSHYIIFFYYQWFR